MEQDPVDSTEMSDNQHVLYVKTTIQDSEYPKHSLKLLYVRIFKCIPHGITFTTTTTSIYLFQVYQISIQGTTCTIFCSTITSPPNKGGPWAQPVSNF